MGFITWKSAPWLPFRSGLILVILTVIIPGLADRLTANAAGIPAWFTNEPPAIPSHPHISVSLVGVTRTNPVTAFLKPKGQAPAKFAVLIDSQDYSKANWTNFTNSVSLDLGPGDGVHRVWFGYQWKTNESHWEGFSVRVVTAAPKIVITNPPESIISQPMIQLQGYSTERLSSLKYDLLDGSGRMVLHNEQGLVNDEYYDSASHRFTTNWFTCYDIDLIPGTNTVVLRCADSAGNALTTNFTFVFTTAGDTTPPSLNLVYPRNRAALSGSEFMVEATTDDPSAKIFALITDANGHTHEMEGLVERNGRVWVEHIPLSEGRSFVTLAALDAAGNSSLTNIVVKKSHDRLTIDDVPSSQLWHPTVTVTGFYSRTNETVWVNGVKATMDATGRWKAEKVPVPKGGTATFDVTTVPNDGQKPEEEADTNAVPLIFWGDAINATRAGVSLPPVDTNQFNRYKCDFYLTNVSAEDLSHIWMLPKESSRYRLRLFDKDGKEAPRTEMGTKRVVALADDLNLKRLTKRGISEIDGVLPLATDRPVCLVSLCLDEEFEMRIPGSYRLEAVAQLLRIEPNGHLTPIALPPAWAEVNVIRQPSPGFFFVNDMHRQGKLRWGPIAQSLQVGLTHRHDWRPKVRDEIQVYVINHATNGLRHFVVPKPEEQCDMTLFDSAGKEVAKTRLGRSQGQPLSVVSPGAYRDMTNWRKMRQFMVNGQDARSCLSFNLHDIFEIKQRGKFRLMYELRLYQVGPNGQVEGLRLPAVMLPVDIFITPNEE